MIFKSPQSVNDFSYSNLVFTVYRNKFIEDLEVKDEKIEIAGKTGTSEKYIEGVGYASEKYISSFASIFPYKNPKFIMIVSIDEPDPNKYFGGDVSAPVVGRLSKFMMRLKYL